MRTRRADTVDLFGGTRSPARVTEARPRFNRVRSTLGAIALACTIVAATLPSEGGATVSTFLPRMDQPTGARPFGMASGDFNGDSIPDLITANIGALLDGRTASVLLGNGDGTFRAGQLLSTEPGIMFFSVADLNEDGVLDLVGLNQVQAAYPPPISVFLGNGDGTFQSRVNYGSFALPPGFTEWGNYGTKLMALADMDGDHHVDLVLSTTEIFMLVRTCTTTAGSTVVTSEQDLTGVSPGLYVRFPSSLGIPPGTKVVSVEGPTSITLSQPAITSGTKEIHFTSLHCAVAIWTGIGNGTFNTPTASYDPAFGGDGVVVGDVNRDGLPDIVSTNFSAAVWTEMPSTVNVMIQNADHTLRSPATYSADQLASHIRLADLDGDGKLDIVTANQTKAGATGQLGSLSVFRNNGDGTFGARVDFPTDGSGSREGLEVADVNGDQVLDLVSLAFDATSNPSSAGKVVLFLGLGGGTFGPRIDYPAMRFPKDLVVRDLNGDGSADVAVTNNLSNTISVFLNGGCDPLRGSITGVLPNRGGDAGERTVTIYGCGFEAGATARLVRGGAVIDGNPVTVAPDGVMKAVFNLAGQTRGLWDVEVSNAGMEPAIRTGGFTIEVAIAPTLTPFVMGPVVNRVDRPHIDTIALYDNGNDDFWKDWAFACIENHTCIKEQKIKYVYGTNECLIDQFPSPSGSLFTLPWSVPNNTTEPLKEVYRIYGKASPETDPQCCLTTCPEKALTSVSIFQAKGNGASGPGAVITAQDAGNKEGLLFRFSAVNGGSPAWPSASGYQAHFLDDLQDMVAVKLEALITTFTNDPCNNTTLAFEDEVILRAVDEALKALPSQYAADVTRYRGAFDTIYGTSATHRGEFRSRLKEICVGLDASAKNPSSTWVKETDASPRICCYSKDPNSKDGPAGVGTAGYIRVGKLLNYTAHFENQPDAALAAAEVAVTDQLDPTKVDLGTFSLGQVTFGSHTLAPPPGLKRFQSVVDLRPDMNLKVRVLAQLNETSGLLTVRFQSLDPVTGLEPDDTRGFLPPNATPPEGEGSISFTLAARSDLSTGTEIGNRATVVFDTNAPIPTNEWLNTIDDTKPSSRVDSLAAVPGQETRIAAMWSGPDVGSGIETYAIYVSDNGGPYTLWKRTDAQQDTFPGMDNHTYGFYSVARDRVGLQEDPPTPLVPDAAITIHACTLAMGFDFTPRTLNLRSMGHWVTGYLEPPAPFTPADIDTGSIRVNDAVPVDPAGPVEVGDHDHDGIPDLMVKFDRAAVDLRLSPGDSVRVAVTGTVAGHCFQGSDHVRVLRAVVTAPAAGAALAPGAATTVRWTIPSGINIQSVALLSSTDNGLSWNLDASGLPNTGSADWVVPNVTTAEGRVAIVLVESSDETGYLVDGVLGTSGPFSIGNVTGVESGGKAEFALGRLIPNPAQQALRIAFSLPDGRPARIEVFNVAGRLVAAREVGSLGPGPHTITLGDRAALASGVYIMRLTQGGKSLTRRAVLVR